VFERGDVVGVEHAQERGAFPNSGVDQCGVANTQILNGPLDVSAGQSAFHAARRALEQRGIAGQLRTPMPSVKAMDSRARELPLPAFQIQVPVGQDQHPCVAVLVGEPGRGAARGEHEAQRQEGSTTGGNA